MLYYHIDIFNGDNRKILLQDFILEKNFYQLFLHWDEVVRNTFHQFIIYKA